MSDLQPLMTANQPTPTGRIYSAEIVEKLAEKVMGASVVLDPGNDIATPVDRICAIVDEVVVEDGVLKIGIKPVQTPHGIILKTLLGENLALQYYTCGTGTVTGMKVQDDYEFLHIGVSNKHFDVIHPS